MNITALPISISQMPLDSLGMLWSDDYSHTDDILHLTPSLSRILEACGCGPFTVHLIYLCVSASFASLIFSVTPFTLLCTPTSPSPASHPPECHQLFHHLPPLWSVSLPQDLSSDWDGMFQGCTIPGTNEILNQFMEPPPMALPPYALSLSDPFISAPPPPPLYPAVVHLFSNMDSYLFRCLLEWILTLPLLPPYSLSVLLLPLSVRHESAPLPLFILPHPTRPVQTAALLQFMGLLQQLPAAERKSKKKTGQRTWETCGGNWNMWLKKRVVDKDRGWIRALNKWLKESGAQDHSSSIEATMIPVCC